MNSNFNTKENSTFAPKNNIKILVADDHCIVRDGIKMVIRSNFSDAEIIEATNGNEVLEIAYDNPDIDIFMIDYFMPNYHGNELLTMLKSSHPNIPVMFISSSDECGLVQKSIKNGASGFIPKTTPPQVIVQAINLVLAGGTYIPKNLLEASQQNDLPQDNQKPVLTGRQLEILKLIAHGDTDKEIANKLDVSRHTVKAHTTCLRNQLGAKNRTMAVECARKLGLIK